MSEGINLLDPNKQNTPTVFLRRLQTMRVVMIGILFLVSVVSVMLFILVALSPLPSLQQKEQSLRDTLAQSKDSMIKFALVNERTDTISTLLAGRHSFDQTIAVVQSKLSSDTSVTAVQIENGAMIVTVESPSLQSLDTFTNNMVDIAKSRKSFSQLSLTDLSIDSTTNLYSLSLQMNLL